MERLGATVEITSDYQIALQADGLVVPGVGAFGSCMNQLKAIAGDVIIKERLLKGLPTLGICVGMQVLFQSSDESEELGIGIFQDSISRLDAPLLPHIGWNEVAGSGLTELRMLKGLENELFYFVHSYAATSMREESALSTAKSNYGEDFIAALEFRSISAVQFHPEKSGDAGLQLLKNWNETL